MSNSVQLKKQADFIFNGEIHTEQDITDVVEEICKIKKISSIKFKQKLKIILIKANILINYKKNLQSLYLEKIDKNNTEHMNMLYSIYSHFKKNDKNINDVDKKWCKKQIYKLNIFYFSTNWISRKRPFN